MPGPFISGAPLNIQTHTYVYAAQPTQDLKLDPSRMKLVDLHVLLVCFFFVVTCSGSKLICFFLGRICFRSVITWLHPKPMLGFPERHMCPFRNLVGSSFTLFAQEQMPFAFGAAQDGRDLGGNPRPLVDGRRYPSTPATEGPASSARCGSSCVP